MTWRDELHDELEECSASVTLAEATGEWAEDERDLRFASTIAVGQTGETIVIECGFDPDGKPFVVVRAFTPQGDLRQPVVFDSGESVLITA